MTAWKAHERRIAARLGGTRTGNRGTATADVTTDWAAIECKERAKLPAWLERAMGQAERAADDAQLPLVVLHRKGQRSDNDLVVLRLGDFIEWFGEMESEGEE